MSGGSRGATISGPRVWVVSADQWPRACLRAELIERGYDATGFVTITDALVGIMLARSLRPALLVFDRHRQAIDEKSRALLLREGVPVLAVVDAGRTDGEPAGPVVETLRRPLTIGAIADAVDRLMGCRSPVLSP